MTGKTREQDIIDSFTALTDRVLGDVDVLDVTAELTRDCARLLDVAAVGLLLADAAGVLHLLAATSEEARRLELFMLQRDEGPCLDCYRSGNPVSVADLRSRAQRWPLFAAAAAEQGFASVHAIPLRLRGETLGALGLFGTSPGALEREDIALAQGLAHVASLAIVQSTTRPGRNDVLPALHGAVAGRAVVETAKGVLAQTRGITMQEAFEELRVAAREQKRPLADVARDVVAGPPPIWRPGPQRAGG